MVLCLKRRCHRQKGFLREDLLSKGLTKSTACNCPIVESQEGAAVPALVAGATVAVIIGSGVGITGAEGFILESGRN